jgi:hypothetical protein
LSGRQYLRQSNVPDEFIPVIADITACPHHRARRRTVTGWHSVDLLPSRVLPAGQGPIAAVRRLFVEGLMALHHAGDLTFFGDLTSLADASAFAAWLSPFRKSEWVVYAKPPFGGPKAVLAYLSRYTTGSQSRTAA